MPVFDDQGNRISGKTAQAVLAESQRSQTETRPKDPQALTIKEQLQNHRSKLEAKKRHLKNLYDKKVRLENEIRGTMRSLKRDLSRDKKVTRQILQLKEEASPREVKLEILKLAESDQELDDLLSEVDQLASELVQMSTPPAELLTEEELKFIRSL